MNNEKDETIYNVPLWEKVMLTIDEAAAYTGVGSRKIRQLMMPKKISGISMVRKSAISGMFSLLMVKVSPAENSEAK